MNSASSGPTDDYHCYDATLNLSAAKLDGYEQERLVNTEMPVKKSEQGKCAAGKSSLLQAMYHWVLSR